MKAIATLILLSALAASGCRNSCGERQGLFSRFRQSDDDHKPAAPCFTEGQPLARSNTGFGNPTPTGYPTGGSSAPIYTGPSFPNYPSYPTGDPLPYPSAPPRTNELPPPGSYIPTPGVPTTPYAVPRPIESSKSPAKAGAMTTGAK